MQDEGAAICGYTSRTTERLHHVSGIPTGINLASHRPLCYSLVADVSATTIRSIESNPKICAAPFILLLAS